MSLASEKTTYEHVVLNDKGVPFLLGTNMKVIELVLEKKAYGWSPEELFFQHPYLTLGQICSALAYYWDHQDKLDRDIEKRLDFANQTRKNEGKTPLSQRLESRGLI